jgi:hypothetical protein
MRFLLLFHAFVSLGLAGLFWALFGAATALSFYLGSLVILINFAVLALVWPIILAKKQIALSIGVIVIKFAIFAWIMNEAAVASAKNHLFLGWFSGGIALVNLSALAAALQPFLANKLKPD